MDLLMLTMTDEMAIVIPSCDKYSDLWPSFFFFFKKYWPDCPYPVYLLANDLKCDYVGVTTIRLGLDVSWASNLNKALDTIKEQRILILLEDYFLTERVDGKLIEHYESLMKKDNLAYIRLVPVPPPDADSAVDERLGIINKGSAYRTSLQAAIWDRDPLIYLLDRTGSPWEFEIKGSFISSEISAPFLSVKNEANAVPLNYYCTAVVQGKWMPGAVRLCKEQGAPLDTTKRPILSGAEIFLGKVKRAIRMKADLVWNKVKKGI
jgi:hypothetical protein